MPARNVIKPYVAEGHYHLYNRCPENQKLFTEDNDYQVFVRLLKRYLAPELKRDPHTGINNPASLADSVDLLSFSLMPNHFHFLVKQHIPNGITSFCRSVLTSYALFFKDYHNHRGSLFQGKLRGILVEGDSYLLHLSRYIHNNPKPLLHSGIPLSSYPYSSYPNFIGLKRDSWIKPGEILNYFSNKNKLGTYLTFVENEDEYLDYISGLTLED